MQKKQIPAGEASTNAFLAFPRCMGITKKKTIPMQHGKTETENCDTSRARTSILTDHEMFSVVNVDRFGVGELASSRGI